MLPESNDISANALIAHLDRPVALVGLMGAGKTSIGKRLAARLGLGFVDADEEIEKAAGIKITDIFDLWGEHGFRDGEAKVIARLVEGPPCIVATGGGAMGRKDTRDLLKSRAITVWLKNDLDIHAKRVINRSHRPLLNDKDPMVVLKAQAEVRYPHYAEADITVETGDTPHGRGVEMVIDALLSYLKAKS